MEVLQNYSLKAHNTFGIKAEAQYYVAVNTIEELKEVYTSATYRNIRKHVLGGGSNVLLTSDIKGMVVHPDITGIKVEKEKNKEIFISSGAGENWDNFVEYCVSRNYGGIENLSLIPGDVGSSPIQNIGAYGAEVKDTLEWVEYFDLDSLSLMRRDNAACKFGYRNSIFKNELKGSVVITRACFRLQKVPSINISYGNIRDELQNIENISIQDVRKVIIAIRSAKLPDPEITGNAGSFFKNPVVPAIHYEKLKAIYPEIPGYPVAEDYVKIPAAWMIQECKWKGYSEGNVGVHKNQPLVLINLGNATGHAVLHLANRIVKSVQAKFDVLLEKEVNIW